MNGKYNNHYIFNLKGFGSSNELIGNVRTTVVFLQNSTYKWNDLAYCKFSTKFESAMAVLEKTAKSHGVYLNIDVEYLSCSIENANIQNRSWLVDFVAACGYTHLSEYQKDIKRKNKCDEAPMVFVWNCEIGEFAACADEHSPNNDEFSVLSSTSSIDTINHEFLHQFGAMDLYFPPDAIASAQRNLSGTIMINGSVIDPLTCYLIGWKKDFSKEVIAFLEDTKHYTMGDCVCAKIERAKNDRNFIGIPTDQNGNPIVPFASFNELVLKANQGDAMACFLLGYCYCFGIIVKKDLNKAIELYKYNIAHPKALTIANYTYAKTLLKKQSLTPSEQKEVQTAFMRAIASNHVWAANDWGVELLRGKNTAKDMETGYKYLCAACSPATSYIVLYEYKSVCYCSKNIPELHKALVENSNLYEVSCMKGSELAKTTIGIALLEGKHLPKDEKKAFELFLGAAKANDYRALFELGYCYEYGIGVEKDLYKANYYYELGEKASKPMSFAALDRENFKRIFKRV